MTTKHGTWRAATAALLAGLSLGLAAPAHAAATMPAVAPVTGPGSPFLGLGAFDLKALGYVVEEYFVTGTATSYKLKGEATADGACAAEAAGTAPYATRVVVVRPADPKAFNGTAAVEWLNVTGGLDAGPDWTYSHREMLRSGYAYVGVSAQKVGVEGGQSLGGAGMPLKKQNPARYGTLVHPGDQYSFDAILLAGRRGGVEERQGAGAAEGASARAGHRRRVAVGGLHDHLHRRHRPDRQGLARRLLCPLPFSGGAPHRRPPRCAADQARGPGPAGVKLRPDLRVPVMTLISETDLIGSNLSGFWTAEQPDTAKLRIWEMPGTAHVDNYMFMIGGFDDGHAPPSSRSSPASGSPPTPLFGAKMAHPINSAPQHHYVAMAAMAAPG